MADAETISFSEIEEMGYSNIVHAGEVDEDNPLATYMASDRVQQDRDGRQIISYKQFKEFDKRGVRMDNFAMRMRWPGKRGARTIQASKYLKWLGAGYIPVGVTAEDFETFSEEMLDRFRYDAEVLGADMPIRRRQRIVNESNEEETEDVTIYKCRDKYPDCGRFFDSKKGLTTHWGRDHGEWSKEK